MTVGLAYRPVYRRDLLLDRAAVGYLEITAEHFTDGTREQCDDLALLRHHWPLLVHGLDLSLGSATGLDDEHLERVAAVVEACAPPWWSDHLAFTRAGGRRLGHLAPLPPTRTAVAVVARNVARARRVVATPLLLENIGCPLELTGEFDEPGFLRAVADATGCGLLFDVSNAWIGCANRGEDFRAYLDRFPLDRVVQLHVAGFRRQGELLLDSHADAIAEPVFAAVREVLARCSPRAVIVERDDDLPPWPVMRAELDRLR